MKRGRTVEGTALVYDVEEEKLCEWCGKRQAEEEHLVVGLGYLALCKDCSLLLLSSIIDIG